MFRITRGTSLLLGTPGPRPVRRHRISAGVLGLLCILTFPVAGTAQRATETVEMKDAISNGPMLEFQELLRIGSLSGEHDAFGRIWDARFTASGRIAVADVQSSQVLVFDHSGRFMHAVGRAGDGPGEFRFPAVLGPGPEDSLLVWDARSGRVSVFDSTGRFARAFGLPNQWVVSGIEFLPDAQFLVAASDPFERGGLHFLDQAGRPGESFGPPAFLPLTEPFERTLLGGYVDVVGDGARILYTRKSPYEIWFFNGSHPVRRCVGHPQWTTDPRDVVNREGRGVQLDWNRYVHSARVISLFDGLLINLVFDPVGDRRLLDLVTEDCRLLRRHELREPIIFTDYRSGRMLGVRNLEYPEVLVYSVRKTLPDETVRQDRRDPRRSSWR